MAAVSAGDPSILSYIPFFGCKSCAIAQVWHTHVYVGGGFGGREAGFLICSHPSLLLALFETTKAGGRLFH